MTAARTLTDADLAAIAEVLRGVVREAVAERDVKPANEAPATKKRHTTPSFRASIEVGTIARPPVGSGVYCACLPMASGEWGLQWAKGAFYVGLASDFLDRLTFMHHRWDQIREARAVFVVVHEPGPAQMREALRQLEGGIERVLAKRVGTVNAAQTYVSWSPEIGAVAADAVRACMALRAEVLS